MCNRVEEKSTLIFLIHVCQLQSVNCDKKPTAKKWNIFCNTTGLCNIAAANYCLVWKSTKFWFFLKKKFLQHEALYVRQAKYFSHHDIPVNRSSCFRGVFNSVQSERLIAPLILLGQSAGRGQTMGALTPSENRWSRQQQVTESY